MALKFLRDKLFHILFFLGACGMTLLLLNLLDLPAAVSVFCGLLLGLSFFIPLIMEFVIKYRYYKSAFRALDELDKKSLLPEMLSDGGFMESEFQQEMLTQCGKSMNDQIAEYGRSVREYREYIEMWVHEIKTPIASGKLLAENNPGAATASMSEELDKIEAYVEQALYYAKSSSVEKDYIIREVSLKQVLNAVIRRNSKDCIHRNIRLRMENIDLSVYSDPKWMEFILNQLFINTVKYMELSAKEKSISITAKENPNNILLSIQDNGVGIGEKDIDRVFEKGYTGENGRRFGKSTGMGLYLCNKLSGKLGIGLSLTSHPGKGTCVTLLFPKSSMALLGDEENK